MTSRQTTDRTSPPTTTTTFLVLSPATPELAMATTSGYTTPIVIRAQTSSIATSTFTSLASPKAVFTRVNVADNANDVTIQRLLRSENASLSRISSQQPSSPTDLPNLDGIRHVLVSDQADRSLEPAAGYPHPDDQPARICVQSRLRQPRAVVATVPAPLQPSPPRVGVASSSCPSPSVAKPSDSPTSSSRWQHQNSWESVNEDEIKKEDCVGQEDVTWSPETFVASSNPDHVNDVTDDNDDMEDDGDDDDDDVDEDSSDTQGNASVMTEYGGSASAGNGGGIGQSDQPDTKDMMDELCPVCGDKVSGYHYGLLTCESCKGFFKRTVQNKKVYTCVADRSCIIDKTQRKRCPYCRFQKCLDVGMKLEAVRHDRMRGGRNKFGPMYKRDRARKLQVMRQRQAIVVQHNVLGGSSAGGSNSNPSPGSLTYTMSSSSNSLYTPPTLHIKQEIQIPQVTSMTSSPGSSPGPLAQQSGLSGLGSGGLDHSQILAQHTDPTTGGVQWQISSGNKEFQFQTGMGTSLSNSVVGLGGGGGGGGKMPAILREFLSSLDDKEWQSELYKLLQSQSFNQVEVDLFELLCKVLDHNLFAQVDWARNSFYFKELKVDDQMTLLQNSWSEMLILDQIHQRMHNHLPDETTLHNGQKFELLSLALLGVPSMSDTFQELTNKLSLLKFDSADFVCLKFILLLNPDVRNLNNRKHVQDCYDQVRRVLLEYCVNCYPNIPDKFNQLLSLLPDLREMAQRGEDFLYFKHMQGNAPTQTLLMEMLHAKKR